ncbi:MAG: DUF480 domain-containing protein [Planctomycetota bacterium]|jgi:uncharacterized protein YceH (UPF0502 family)
MKLEPTEQRILGVLLEKELAVPDSYPLTASSLLAGCNQKNNRDPVLVVEDFQLSGALSAMAEKGIVLRVSQAGSRAVRYKHQCEEKLGLNGRENAVLAELLLRGPQAPGALKPRVARMGMAASPAEILVVLEGLRARPDGPLVEQLPRQPRERDQRWAHLLGAGMAASEPAASEPAASETTASETTASETTAAAMPQPLPFAATVPSPEPAAVGHGPAAASHEPAAASHEPDELAARVARLERQVAELRSEVARMGERSADVDRE